MPSLLRKSLPSIESAKPDSKNAGKLSHGMLQKFRGDIGSRVVAMTPRAGAAVTQEQMAQVQRELGGIAVALENSERTRQDFANQMDRHGDKIEQLSGVIREVEQVVKSQSAVIQSVALNNYDARLKNLQEITAGLPKLEQDVRLWQAVAGGGFHAIWKIGALLIGAGGVGSMITRLVH